jgi:hypothetical protein
MNDAFDDLERQLREAVKRTSDRRPTPGRGWKRTGAIAVAAAFLVSGAALAATRLRSSSDSIEVQGRKIALRATRDTANTSACRLSEATGLATSSHRVLPEISAVLPALGSPASPAATAKAMRVLTHFPVAGRLTLIAGTLRLIDLQDGQRVVVYVQEGGAHGPGPLGPGTLTDPAACAKVREDRATVLSKDRSAEVKRWTKKRLAEARDTAPGLQTLSVFYVPGRAGAGGGSGISIRPGERLHRGVIFSVEGQSGGAYTGFAGPRTTHMLIRPRRLVPGAPKKVPVRQGFYVFRLPPRTGPTKLLEATADGTIVHRTKVR